MREHGSEIMTETIQAQVDAYLGTHFLRHDPVLEQIARKSEAEGLVPHAVTPLQAQFLALLIKLIGARSVMEIGCLG